MRKTFILTILFLLTGYIGMSQTIRYVKPVAAGTGSGNSWANASADLQAMINASAANDEVWVAAGTYYPTATTDRTISFRMKAGVSIYGDFPPTGNPVFADRNLALYETILSGDIDKNDGPNFANNSGNSYHVVSNNNNGANSTAVLNGFVITAGNANAGSYPNNSGGGMLNIFTSPTLVNVIFVANAASSNGGAMLNVSGVPTLRNAIFSGNNAAGQGGAIANSNASPNITHATFWDNNASSGAGGMFSYTLSSPTIRNSIFWGNTVVDTVVSNIGGDAPAVFNSDIEGGYVGVANINQLPLFINSAAPKGTDGKWGTADDGLAVRPCSPTVNTGTNTGVVATTDITGNPRIVETTTDMGAYENQSMAVVGTRLYVDAAAAANGNGSSWATAFNDLQTALATARICNTIAEIWVAKGTYKPTTGTNRTAYFELVNNVKLYGSFAGTETNLSQRTAAVMAANPTILSGDIDGVPDVVTGSGGTLSITGNGGNSYHVVYTNGVNGTTRLDGFTVSGGNANAPSADLFNRNGGGMYNISSTVRIANVTFTGNNATAFGGSVYNEQSSTAFFKVNFTYNKGGLGGGLYLPFPNNTSLDSTNFTGNLASGGGAIYTEDFLKLNTSKVVGNYASQGGGILCGPSGLGTLLDISRVQFLNNTATIRGGAINASGPVYLNRVFLIGNSANEGGGICTDIDPATRLDIMNSLFAYNNAVTRGGAIYGSVGADVDTKFMTYFRNTAGVQGGAIYNLDLGSTVHYFCIFWGNRKGTEINNIYDEPTPSDPNRVSLLFVSLVEGGYPPSSNRLIFENPRFVDPENINGADGILGTQDDGLALSDCSPAIDYIEPLQHSTNTDIIGNTRNWYVNDYDMGAYENPGTGISLPNVYTEKTQDVSDTLFMDTGCKLLAKVVPDTSAIGAQVLSGNVQVQEWIESTPFNMVRRHYQVTPANNASTAKGRVTLYFTQADFDDYNSRNVIKLPTQGCNTSSFCNTSNIQVVKYSGTSPNGMPGGYPAQTPQIIPNSALRIWWEGKYWSVSFDVTGFSGFFIKTPDVSLPLNLLSFDGKAVQNGNQLYWKTANEVNFSHFEIERSNDGRQFTKIGMQPSSTSGNYNYLDATPAPADQNYYRLKMVDRDGTFTYSRIIRINNTGKALVGEPYPNPAADAASIDISAVENETWTFSVVDVMGRVLHTFTRNLSKGNHTIRLDNLRLGLNYIRIESPSVHEFRKLIKN